MTSADRGSLSSDQLPDFDDPPVVEVALGVEFQPLPSLGAANLTRLADGWAERYPRMEEMPPLPPGPVPGQYFDRPAMVVNVGAPGIRMWRLSDSRDRLLQVQRDRLVLNWQRQQESYPHYDQLRPVFRRALDDLATFLRQRQLGMIRATVAELTYVNRIGKDPEGVTALRRALAGGSLLWDVSGSQVDLRIQQTWRRDHADRPATLSVNADSTPVEGAVLALTYREALPSEFQVDDALESLDRGHVAIVTAFARITSDPMHNQWRRRR